MKKRLRFLLLRFKRWLIGSAAWQWLFPQRPFEVAYRPADGDPPVPDLPPGVSEEQVLARFDLDGLTYLIYRNG